MLRYSHWIRDYPFLRTVGEVYCYATIVVVMIIFMLLAGRRLLALGYPERRVRLFVLLAIGAFLPAGYLSSRVGNRMVPNPALPWVRSSTLRLHPWL